MSSSLITLLAYLFILVPLMLLGYYFARRKMFTPHHKLVMTSVLILNWIFIGVVMIGRYTNDVAPQLPENIGQIGILLPTIHLVTGAIAQLLGTYLVILMWTENTPLAWMAIVPTRNIKPLMRTTLALWLVTVLLGFGIYAVWNSPRAEAADGTIPEATESVDAQAITTEEAPDPAITEEAPAPAFTEEADDDDSGQGRGRGRGRGRGGDEDEDEEED